MERLLMYLALASPGDSVLGPDGWMGYARLMLILGAVLILALAVRFWLPKLTRPGRPSSRRIRVLAWFPLEPRKTLYVVAVGKNFMLLASSEAGVHLMATLDPNEWDEVQSGDSEARPSEKSLLQFIGSIRTARMV
jgi:flagellar biogenesis protein FliO